MSSKYHILALVFLTACGDASQQYQGVNNSGEFDADGVAPRGDNSTPEFVPLASQFLKPSSDTLDRSAVLESVRLTSVLGDLNERIQSRAESLGLTSFSTGLGLTSDSSNLADGLLWEPAGASQRAQLAADLAPLDSGVVREMQLKLDDVPVHSAKVKMVVEQGETTWVSGSSPAWLNSSQRPSTTPFALSVDQARGYAARALSFPEWRFHSAKKTYIPEKAKARAAYLFIVSAEYVAGDRAPWVPLEIAVDADDGKLLWQRPMAMHATATAQVHVENKSVAATAETVTLPDLQATGRLNHSLFDVYNCGKKPRYLDDPSLGNYCQQRATSSSGAFNYSYSDANYDDLVAYTGISKAMARFRALDQSSLRADWDQDTWPGSRENFGLESSGTGSTPRRLMVFVNTETRTPTTTASGKDSTPDNAQYVWQGRTGAGNPEILIGYGSWVGLNSSGFFELGKDMDVVMHEFGHHLVFRGLSNTKAQSVALHEGYSDYFTYAVTGNNLLGENTSPGRASLRSGTVKGRTFTRFARKSDGTYVSALGALSAPHAVGELWSAILWEMRETLGRDASNNYKMDKIVWDSIDLIKNDGEIYDGVVAISESARRYASRFGDNAKQLQDTIHTIFAKYEFANLSSDGQISRTAAMGPGASALEPNTTTTKKKRWGCGDIALAKGNSSPAQASNTNFMALILLIATPLLSSLFHSSRSLRRVRIPVRKREPRSKN